MSKKPTQAQQRRLEQIARGEITRSGESWVYGHYSRSSGIGIGSITYTMMCNLHDAGWITDELVERRTVHASVLGRDISITRWRIKLTDAGLALLHGMSAIQGAGR